MKSKFSEVVDQIWNCRLNQQSDLALSLFASLKAEMNLMPQDSCLKVLELNPSQIDYISVAAIEVSILRLRKKMNESRALLDQIERMVEPGNLLKSFYFQFERGLTHFISSNWTESLEHFIYAKGVSASEAQRMACLGNLLFCTENLGLPSEQILSELRLLLSELDETKASGIRAQLRAFDVRQAWRRGDIKNLEIQNKKISDISRLNQADYLSLYLSQLPYFQISNSIELNEFINKAGELFNQNFRMQTLIGDRSPVSGIIRLGDWLERLYLWTWRWMTNPEKYPLNLVTETLNQIPEETMRSLKSATAEDQMLFKITLGWLTIFDPSAELSISSVIQYSALEDSVTFKLEKLAQMYTKSILNSDEEQSHILRNEILKSKSNLADYYIQFADQFRTAKSDLTSTSSHGIIEINLSRYEISKNNKIILQSATLCRAIRALHDKEAVRLEDLAYHTFFLKEYDSFLHGSKVSNLLSRINKLLPEKVRVLQRDGKAFMKGDKTLIRLQEASRASEELASDNQWPIFTARWKNILNLNDQKNLAFSQVYSQLQIQGEFTRSEFQTKYNVSKTQAQRLIRGWMDSRKIQKIGEGKAVRYIFNDRKAV